MTGRGSGVIRVGVVGCGVISYWVYLRLLQKMKGVKLVAAADPSPEARDRARKIVRVPVVADADEIMGNLEVDAVVICAPTGLHAELSVTALEAGKHTFLEKPIATCSKDAKRVMEAAKVSGLTAMVGYSRRLHPLVMQARAMIANNELGAIHAVQSAFCEPIVASDMSAWRKSRGNGGGVLLDLGSHHFDLVRWLLTSEVVSVDCSVDSAASDGDSAWVSLSMKSGESVQSFFSYRTARADYLEIIGERGTLLIDRHRTALTLRVARRWGYGTRKRFVMPERSAAQWRARRLVSPSYEPSYATALDLFIRSIRGENAACCTLADATKSLDIVLAAEASALSGSRVTLDS